MIKFFIKFINKRRMRYFGLFFVILFFYIIVSVECFKTNARSRMSHYFSLRERKNKENSSTTPGFTTENPRKQAVTTIPMNLSKVILTLTIGLTAPAFAATKSATSFQRPRLYSIEMTDPPSMIPRTKQGEESLLERFTKAQVVLFGYHNVKNSIINDFNLAEEIVSRMIREEKGIFSFISGDNSNKDNRKSSSSSSSLSIGLDFIENSNANKIALEKYITSAREMTVDSADRELMIALKGNIREDDLILSTPLLHFARLQGIKLIPLGIPKAVEDELIGKGLAGLTSEQRQTLVPSAEDYINSFLSAGFQKYNERVITEEYDSKIKSKELKSSVTLENYNAYRTFSDEALAYAATKYITTSPDSTLLLFSSSARVKFGYGIQERINRMIGKLKSTILDESSRGKTEVLSVIMNPTSEESLSLIPQINLSLGYGSFLKDSKPFANYLWFSSSPMMKYLTRVKNPISKEGDKPEGESSVLGVFR